MLETIPLTRRERETLVAALRFWREEMVPHPDAQPPYFDVPAPEPLTEEEIHELSARLSGD